MVQNFGLVQSELVEAELDDVLDGMDQDAADAVPDVADRGGRFRDVGLHSREGCLRELDDCRQYACSSR